MGKGEAKIRGQKIGDGMLLFKNCEAQNNTLLCEPFDPKNPDKFKSLRVNCLYYYVKNIRWKTGEGFPYHRRVCPPKEEYNEDALYPKLKLYQIYVSFGLKTPFVENSCNPTPGKPGWGCTKGKRPRRVYCGVNDVSPYMNNTGTFDLVVTKYR